MLLTQVVDSMGTVGAVQTDEIRLRIGISAAVAMDQCNSHEYRHTIHVFNHLKDSLFQAVKNPQAERGAHRTADGKVHAIAKIDFKSLHTPRPVINVLTKVG